MGNASGFIRTWRLLRIKAAGMSLFMVVTLCTPNICSWVHGVHFCEGLFIRRVLCYLDKSTLKVHCFYKVFCSFLDLPNLKNYFPIPAGGSKSSPICSTAFSKWTGTFCGSFTHDSKVSLQHIAHLLFFNSFIVLAPTLDCFILLFTCCLGQDN